MVEQLSEDKKNRFPELLGLEIWSKVDIGENLNKEQFPVLSENTALWL